MSIFAGAVAAFMKGVFGLTAASPLCDIVRRQIGQTPRRSAEIRDGSWPHHRRSDVAF